ncbi:MAG: hypothetical protein ACRDZ4_03415 [Egibacteraceae bacterium]
MTDFEAALRARLKRNEELARERARAEEELDRTVEERQAEEERRQRELQLARQQRHAELVEHLKTLTGQLKRSSPETFIVRAGWSKSGEEFIARLSTRTLEPARTLFIELDRDDDEVLARWTSDLGNSVELWRLLDVSPSLLTELVLQIADQELWHGRSSPPPYPRPEGD